MGLPIGVTEPEAGTLSHMIEIMDDVPEGVLGFSFSGAITRADYDEILMPPIRQAIESGDKVRALCLLGPDFDGYDKGAVWEDVKAGAEWGIGRHSSWDRIAVVTDQRKIRKLASMLGWMSPGELKVFGTGQIEAARVWASGGSPAG